MLKCQVRFYPATTSQCRVAVLVTTIPVVVYLKLPSGSVLVAVPPSTVSHCPIPSTVANDSAIEKASTPMPGKHAFWFTNTLFKNITPRTYSTETYQPLCFFLVNVLRKLLL